MTTVKRDEGKDADRYDTKSTETKNPEREKGEPLTLTLSITTGQEQQPIEITGVGFGTEAGAIAFDGVPGTVQRWTDKSIVTFVPYGAHTGQLVVLTKNGRTYSAEFTVVPGVFEAEKG